MPPGANTPKTGTGTVPKTKSRSNSVPREVVAPTRRDMQQNSSMDASFVWRPIPENGGASNSNVTGLLCFYDDLDTAATHDHNRFVPVRPQPRSLNISQHDDEVYHTNSFTSNSPSNMSANTAIVMPTTPGTSRRESSPFNRDRVSSYLNQMSDSGAQGEPIASSQSINNNLSVRIPDKQQLEERLSQIRDYLKVTTSLMQSADGRGNENPDPDLEDMARLTVELRDSEAKLVAQLKERFKDGCVDQASTDQNESKLVGKDLDQIASTHMQRFAQLVDILTEQEKLNFKRNTNYRLTDQEYVNQAQAIENNDLRQSQENNMLVSFDEVDRSKVSQKDRNQSRGDNISRASKDSRDTSAIINSICQDLCDLQNIRGDRSEIAQQNDQQLQAELKSILASFKSVNSKGNQTATNSSSREATPISEDANTVSNFESNLIQLQNRLSKLRAESVYHQDGSLKMMKERIAYLKEMVDSRDELTRALSERDDHLAAEHQALQDKLRDLHTKKEQIESLVFELQSISSQEQSAASMRTQLANYQGLLDTVLQTEAEWSQSGEEQSTSQRQNVNVNKFANIKEDRSRNLNVYHPTEYRVDNRDFPENQEENARANHNRFDKKINKNLSSLGPRERQQLLLKAELQAKKKELEQFMRKDQDRTTVINQDCSESIIDKSVLPRYSQEDNLVSQWRVQSMPLLSDNDYTSDEDHEIENNAASIGPMNTGNNVQLNNAPQSSTNNTVNINKTQQQGHVLMNSANYAPFDTQLSSCSTPVMAQPRWRKVSQSSNHHLNNVKTQQASSVNDTSMTNNESLDMSLCNGMDNNMSPSTSSFWRKPSQDGAASTSSLPGERVLWGGPWSNMNINQRVDNTTGSESLPALSSNAPNQNSRDWWQKKAQQLQQQIELTSNLCQSIISDQNIATASQSPSSSVRNEGNVYTACTYAPVPTTYVPFQSQFPLLPPQIVSPEVQSQQLVAASQLNLQTMILTSLHQCCHLLWMQQKEITALRSMILNMQENSFANINREQQTSSTGNSPQNSALLSRPNQTKPITATVANQMNDINTIYQSNVNYLPQSTHSNVNNFNHGIHNQATMQATAMQQVQHNNIPLLQNPNSMVQQNFSNNIPCVVPQNIQCPSPNFNNQNNNTVTNNLMPLAFQTESQRPQCVQNVPGPPQVPWNGVQALNNQVPPGNRANNYWDNFRSYSRQNLLSTTSKTNEVLVHSPSPLIDRSHNTFRTNGCLSPLDSTQINNPSLPKLNTNTAQEESSLYRRNKSQVRQQCEGLAGAQTNESNHTNSNQQNLDLASPMFNVEEPHLLDNHNQNLLDMLGNPVTTHPPSNINLEQFVNGFERGDARRLIESPLSPTSNLDSEKCSKHDSQRNVFDRNEWCENVQNENTSREQSKTKLFDILRENVYKEVSNLISANESRPHFLIQLFRDLQLISSDGLRHRTLQSIQGVVTDSRSSQTENEQGASRQASNRGGKLDLEIQMILLQIIPFFKLYYEDNVFSDEISEVLRSFILKFVTTIPSLVEANKVKQFYSYFESHLNNVLERALSKFNGCRLQEIEEELLSLLSEMLLTELTYVLTNENIQYIPSTNNSVENDSSEQSPIVYDEATPTDSQENSERLADQESVKNEQSISESMPTLHDGDLAEADQSHHENEEGAVGGILLTEEEKAVIREDTSDNNRKGNAEADLEWITEISFDCC